MGKYMTTRADLIGDAKCDLQYVARASGVGYELTHTNSLVGSAESPSIPRDR